MAQFLTSKQVKAGQIRLKKPVLCQRYKHYAEMSGVCSNSHGHMNGPGKKTIDHVIELQIIAKALEYCSEYKRKKWMKELRSVSNNRNNLQTLSLEENKAKRAAVEKWLAQWPNLSAKEYFTGDEEQYFMQMDAAWRELKPKFRKKNLNCLSNTIDKMIYG